MPARDIIVSMPFGGDDVHAQRRAILNFKRIQYIVETKCEGKVKTAMPGEPHQEISYAVNIASTALNQISQDVMARIKDADILIALVNLNNANVTCEVRARREYNLPVILIGKWPEAPAYEKDFARIELWNNQTILDQIETLVKSDCELDGFDIGIPEPLRSAIDTHDGKLSAALAKALKEAEKKLKPKQDEKVTFLQRMLSEEITNFYPCSIVEFSFSAPYVLNPEKPPIVSDFDELFCLLYGYAGKSQAIEDCNGKSFTLEHLTAKIKEYVNEQDWELFILDQERLTKEIIKAKLAKAKVPLKINDNHEQFAGKNLLPCVVAQVKDGSSNGEYTLYLLVEYIEVPRATVSNQLP